MMDLSQATKTEILLNSRVLISNVLRPGEFSSISHNNIEYLTWRGRYAPATLLPCPIVRDWMDESSCGVGLLQLQAPGL